MKKFYVVKKLINGSNFVGSYFNYIIDPNRIGSNLEDAKRFESHGEINEFLVNRGEQKETIFQIEEYYTL